MPEWTVCNNLILMALYQKEGIGLVRNWPTMS